MISVTIPAYNGAEFLDSALASIEAQHFADREVLLIDDGSPDELRPPAYVRYFRQPHRDRRRRAIAASANRAANSWPFSISTTCGTPDIFRGFTPL